MDPTPKKKKEKAKDLSRLSSMSLSKSIVKYL